MAGSRNSWAPMPSISWRITSPTFWWTLQPSGSIE